MSKFSLLEKRVKEAALLLSTLKVENKKLKEETETLRLDLKFKDKELTNIEYIKKDYEKLKNKIESARERLTSLLEKIKKYES